MDYQSKTKGGNACDECGCVIKWAKLYTGVYVACEPSPFLYFPDEDGRELFIDDLRDGKYVRGTSYRKGGLRANERPIRGWKPHVYQCKTPAERWEYVQNGKGGNKR